MLKLIIKSGLFWTKLNSPFINHSKIFIKKQINKKGLIALTHFKINFNKLVAVLSFFIKKNMKILFIDYTSLDRTLIKIFTKNINQFFLDQGVTQDLFTNFNGVWERFSYITKYLRESYQKDILNLSAEVFEDFTRLHKTTINEMKTQEEQLLLSFNMAFFFQNASLSQFIDGVFFFADYSAMKNQATTANYITFSFYDINTKLNNEIYFLFGNHRTTQTLMLFLFLLENSIKQKIIFKNLII